jgi:peroxiredoxin
MGIASTTSRLNEALRNFYVYADSIYNASAIRIVKQRNRKLADKIIADYDSVAHLQQCNDDFFNDFVRYQQAKIFTLARLKSPKKVAEKYFLHDSVAFNQEAYWQTLDLVYSNFLSMALKGKASAMVREVLAKPSPHFSELSAAVASDSSFLDATQLREMLVVKGIYDAYYSGTLSPTATDTLLYSTVAEAVTETARIAANNILVRLNRMRVGTLAPDFTLYDFEGVERKLSDFKGLFVYLSFQHSKNFASQKDFPALQVINKKYERLMYVVNIFTDENVDEAKTLVARGKYNWLPLSFINDQAVVLRYGITHEPSYFLIDPEGRLSLSPAPSPTEERLVTAIAQQMQKYKTEKMRRTPPKIRDIYDMVREVK